MNIRAFDLQAADDARSGQRILQLHQPAWRVDEPPQAVKDADLDSRDLSAKDDWKPA
jgi:hypothetical protein